MKRELAAKVARGMFQPVARHLRTDIAEDRLTEGIAMAFETYAKSVAKGALLHDAILVHACRLRAGDVVPRHLRGPLWPPRPVPRRPGPAAAVGRSRPSGCSAVRSRPDAGVARAKGSGEGG